MKYSRKIKKLIVPASLFVAVVFCTGNILGQKSKFSSTDKDQTILASLDGSDETKDDAKFTKADVNFAYFEKVTDEAKKHRSSRLVDFKTFLAFSKEENTIILDTRSKRMYDRMHIKGAIHINFSDFTQDYLAEMIPNNKTRILIYCNNNFYQEPIFEIPFPTKAVILNLDKASFRTERPVETLALNIPTYINLYGYNYKNVYELSELVSSQHKGLEMEGTDAKNFKSLTPNY